MDKKRFVAQTLHEEGRKLRSEGSATQIRKAIDKFEQALSLWQDIGDQRAEARSLNTIGLAYDDLGEKQKAIDYYHKALLLNKALGDRQREALALNNIGAVYLDLGDRHKAIEYFNQALSLRQTIGDLYGQAETLNNLGVLYHYTDENLKALDHYNQAHAIFRNLGDLPAQANMLNNLALVYNSLGENQKALDHYDQALPLWRKVGDRRGEGLTLNNIGLAYDTLGEYQKAFDYYREGLRLREEIGDRAAQANSLNNIGAIYKWLGDYQKAIEYYHRSLPLSRAVGNHRDEAITLANIGVAYFSLGDKEKALEHYNQALLLNQALGDRNGEANTLRNAGRAYFSSGEYQKALEHFTRSLQITREISDRRGESVTLAHLGDISVSLKDTQKAIDYYNQSLDLSRALGNRVAEVMALYGIARAERARGNLRDARALSVELLNINETIRSEVVGQELRASYFATVRDHHAFYIDLLMQQHSEHPTEGYDAAALQMSERARARILLETLAESRADIRHGVEARLIEQERSLQQRISAKAERMLRLKSNQRSAAQAAPLEKEIDALTIELQQIQAEIRQKSPRYTALTQPQPLTLYEIQRQLDAGSLLLEYSLGEERSYLWAVSADSIESYELPKRAAIKDAAEKLLAVLSTPRGRRTGETLARQRKRAAELDAKTQTAAAELSQMLLAPVAARLGKKRLVIVADGTLQYIPFAALPAPQTEIQRDGGAGRQGDKETRRQGKSAIRDPQSAIRNPLIVNHEIVSLPSASTIAVLRRELAGRKPAPRMVAAIADPVFDVCDDRFKRRDKCEELSKTESQKGNTQTQVSHAPADISPLTRAIEPLRDGDVIRRLPVSKEEAEIITKLTPAGTSKLAHGFEASIAAVKSTEMAEYRYVHFATHGILNDRQSELSGILLSLVDDQGRQQNGFLRSGEVYNLNLPAEVVTLSACETALGKDVRGEGRVGLTRGFMYAGAARVVASLWKVEEEGTKELMIRFYRGMLGKRQLRPAAALRQAQISMLRQPEWRSPYYWSAFIPQGEWR
ncbi:MAG: CHAT domain-containing tetratricopeptide repeat protein [Blastocatellia bacterium]